MKIVSKFYSFIVKNLSNIVKNLSNICDYIMKILENFFILIVIILEGTIEFIIEHKKSICLIIYCIIMASIATLIHYNWTYVFGYFAGSLATVLFCNDNDW